MRNIDVELKFVTSFQEKEELFQHFAGDMVLHKRNGLFSRHAAISMI